MESDNVDCKLYNPALDCYQYITTDEAAGKMVERIAVFSYDGTVVVYLRDAPEKSK